MGPDSGTGWPGLGLPLLPCWPQASDCLASASQALGSGLCRHSQFRTIILVWKIFSKPTGVCIHYTIIFSHINISRDHRRQDPHVNHNPHRIREWAAGSRLLTHSPKPSNALQLPVSPCPRMAPSSIDSAWPSFEPLVCHLPGVVSFDRGDQNCLWHDF